MSCWPEVADTRRCMRYRLHGIGSAAPTTLGEIENLRQIQSGTVIGCHLPAQAQYEAEVPRQDNDVAPAMTLGWKTIRTRQRLSQVHSTVSLPEFHLQNQFVLTGDGRISGTCSPESGLCTPFRLV